MSTNTRRTHITQGRSLDEQISINLILLALALALALALDPFPFPFSCLFVWLLSACRSFLILSLVYPASCAVVLLCPLVVTHRRRPAARTVAWRTVAWRGVVPSLQLLPFPRCRCRCRCRFMSSLLLQSSVFSLQSSVASPLRSSHSPFVFVGFPPFSLFLVWPFILPMTLINPSSASSGAPII